MPRCPSLLAVVLLACLLQPGCTTYADRVRQVRQAYYAGDLETAQRLIDEGLERDGPDSEVLRLEQAVVQLAAGRPREAEAALRQVRDRFEHLAQTSIAEQTVSLLTEDDRRAYAGEDYEQVLVRAMLALTSLVNDGLDAEAYSLQIEEKQQQIIQSAVDKEGHNPKTAYQHVALGPYIRALLREETHRDYDDAARNWALVAHWQPDFQAAQYHLARATSAVHSQKGHGVLCVFALLGRGPYKEEVSEMPTSAALLIADRILSQQMKHSLPPTIAPIKIPKLVAARNSAITLEVLTAGRPYARTETITNVTQMAMQQYEAVLPEIMARAVVRRVVKKGMAYGAKEALGVQGGSLESLALDLAGVAWEATENADTRCWGLLPDTIQVARIELPAGEHDIGLRAIGHAGHPLAPPITHHVTIDDGRNTYLIVNVPDAHVVGRVLSSGQPTP